MMQVHEVAEEQDKEAERVLRPLRRYMWSQPLDTEFSRRVNHATSVIQCGGDSYLYSVGGYHEQDVDREGFEAVMAEEDGHYFSTGPIDIQCLNIGKP